MYNTNLIDVLNSYSSDAKGKYIETVDATKKGIDLMFDESQYVDTLDTTDKSNGVSTNLQESVFKVAVEVPAFVKTHTTKEDFDTGIKTSVSTTESVNSVVLARQGV